MSDTKKKVKVKRKFKKWGWTEVVSTIILTILVACIIIPFWNAVVISVQTNADYARHPFTWWPNEFTWANYKYLLYKGSTLLQAYKVTIFVTLTGTLGSMVVKTMAAYGFSRKFPGKRFFFIFMIIPMYFGGGLIPTYLLLKNLNLLNSHAGVILISIMSVYDIIIIKNSFEAVPIDLQEAAMIDGATDLRIFGSVMLPLVKPMLATFSLFTAVGYWNAWYWPMLILRSSKLATLQLFLRNITEAADRIRAQNKSGFYPAEIAQNIFSEGVKMATVFLVIAPIMMVYPFLQKYFAKGIMIGAVKM